MNKTLNDYLKSGNTLTALSDYDFKNESPWQDVNNETNAIEKFRLYKNKEAPAFDCDTSFLTLDIVM